MVVDDLKQPRTVYGEVFIYWTNEEMFTDTDNKVEKQREWEKCREKCVDSGVRIDLRAFKDKFTFTLPKAEDMDYNDVYDLKCFFAITKRHRVDYTDESVYLRLRTYHTFEHDA